MPYLSWLAFFGSGTKKLDRTGGGAIERLDSESSYLLGNSPAVIDMRTREHSNRKYFVSFGIALAYGAKVIYLHQFEVPVHLSLPRFLL